LFHAAAGGELIWRKAIWGAPSPDFIPMKFKEISRRIRQSLRQGLAREPAASSQDIVDLVLAPHAMARRMAGPQRPLQFQARGLLAALQCAGEPPRLTRQIVERGFQTLQTKLPIIP